MNKNRNSVSNLSKVIIINLVLIIGLFTLIEYISAQFVQPPRRHFQKSFQLNHTWKPNASKIHREWTKQNPDFPEPYTHYFNKQGWLETYDIVNSKPKDTFRIFYLGDSHTEGTAPMDQSLPSRVENYLNSTAESKDLTTRFEVINTGTSSYSPTIYYILLRYHILQYSPDLIVMNIGMNDDFDDWKYKQTLVVDDDGNPFASPPRDIYKSSFFEGKDKVIKATIWTRLQLFLIENSSAYNWFLQYRIEADLQNELNTNHESEPSENQYEKHAWLKNDNWDDKTTKQVDYTLDLIKKVIFLAKENAIKIAVSTHPAHRQYNQNNSNQVSKPDRSSKPHREIKKITTEAGAIYIDSYNQLESKIKLTEQTKYYYKNDGHFNPRGYKIWADVHIDYLMDSKNNLLPASIYN